MADVAIDKLVVSVEARTAQMERQLKKLTGQTARAAKTIEGHFGGLKKSFADAGTAFRQNFLAGVSPAAIIGGLGIGAIGAGISQAINDVADIGELATRIGLGTDALQALQKQALATGVTSEQLVKGLQAIGEQAATSGSFLEKLFAANNKSLRDANGNLRPMIEIIKMYAELLRNAGTEQEKLAIATGVMGDRIGRELVEMFNQGARGVDQAYADMIKSGNHHSEAQIREAERIRDNYNIVMGEIATAWQRMVLSMVSAFTPIDERIRRAAIEVDKTDRRTPEQRKMDEEIAQLPGYNSPSKVSDPRREALEQATALRAAILSLAGPQTEADKNDLRLLNEEIRRLSQAILQSQSPLPGPGPDWEKYGRGKPPKTVIKTDDEEKEPKVPKPLRVKADNSAEEAQKARDERYMLWFNEQQRKQGIAVEEFRDKNTKAADAIKQANEDAARASAEAWEKFSSGMESIAQGVYTDLMNGASAAETLQNALRRLADTAFNELMGLLFQAPSGGGMSPFASLLQSAFGGGAAAATAAPSVPVASGLYGNAPGPIGAPAGNAGMSVRVYPPAGQPVATKQRSGGDGRALDIYIGDQVRKVAPSVVGKMMPAQFGVTPALTRRT